MVRLGYLKQAGAGMPQDLPGAFALYKQAADTGDVEGQFMHAISHAQGAGTKKNPVLARDLLLSPAHAGHQPRPVHARLHDRDRGRRPEA